MHQSKKGNDWHFGLKAHIGVDMASGLVHTLDDTAGNVSDVTQAHALLHGDEVAAMGDAGYGKSDTSAAIMYALNLWPALSRYCDDAMIEIDNSAAERALRGGHVLAHIADHPVNRVDEFLPWHCAGQTLTLSSQTSSLQILGLICATLSNRPTSGRKRPFIRLDLSDEV